MAVVQELSAGGTQWPGAAEVERAPWVKRDQVKDRWLVDALRLDLDQGEAEAIALAPQPGPYAQCPQWQVHFPQQFSTYPRTRSEARPRAIFRTRERVREQFSDRLLAFCLASDQFGLRGI